MSTLSQAAPDAAMLNPASPLTERMRQVAGTCESAQDIINIAVTAEAFAVTALGVALDNAAKGTLALDAEQQQTLKAARAAEQAHYDYLIRGGAVPITTTFTVPDPAIFTDVPTFLRTLVGLEETFIAAYIAAAQEFAILGEVELTQVALQIGAVEAEHRAGARYYAIVAGVLTGTPNDVAFEKALYSTVGEAAAALQSLGVIGGSGSQVTFPGPGSIDTTGVTQLTP